MNNLQFQIYVPHSKSSLESAVYFRIAKKKHCYYLSFHIGEKVYRKLNWSAGDKVMIMYCRNLYRFEKSDRPETITLSQSSKSKNIMFRLTCADALGFDVNKRYYIQYELVDNRVLQVDLTKKV